MSASGVQVPKIDNTLGALLVGVMISSSLWGTSCLQSYSYFDNRHRKSSWFTKSFVTLVWLLDTTHEILLCHAAYIYLITHYADVAYLAVLVRSITLQILFSTLLALLAQLFSVWRIWLVTRKNAYIVVPLLIFVVAQFIVSIAYFAKGYTIQAVADEHKLDALAKVSAALSCFTNAPLAVILLYNSLMSPQLLRSGETTLSRTVAFAINSGLFTSLMAIVTFVTVLSSPRTYAYLVFYTLTTKLYSNSLLAVLNSHEPVHGFSSGNQNESNSQSYSGVQGQGQARIGTPAPVMYNANISRNPNTVTFGVYDGTSPTRPDHHHSRNISVEYGHGVNALEGQYMKGGEGEEDYHDKDSDSFGDGVGVMSVGLGSGEKKKKNRKSIVSSFLSLK